MSSVLRHFYPQARDEASAQKLVLKDFRLWLSRDVLTPAGVSLEPPAEMELRDAYDRLCAINPEDLLDAVRTYHRAGFSVSPYRPPLTVRGDDRSTRKPGTRD
jgi:hypothetical protein